MLVQGWLGGFLKLLWPVELVSVFNSFLCKIGDMITKGEPMPMSNALERLYVKITVKSGISEKMGKMKKLQDCAFRFISTKVSAPFQ